MDFDRSVFKDELIAAGMWVPIRVTSTDSPPVVTDGYVSEPKRPDVGVLGQISAEWEIEYEAADFPDLDEGQRVDLLDADGDEISGKAYRVRGQPRVTDNPGADQSGFWKRAALTRL